VVDEVKTKECRAARRRESRRLRPGSTVASVTGQGSEARGIDLR
jgi:hypothetical protein